MGMKPFYTASSRLKGTIRCHVWKGIHRKRKEGTEIRTARIKLQIARLLPIPRYIKNPTPEDARYVDKVQYTVDEAIEAFFLLKKCIEKAVECNLESGYGLPTILGIEEKVAQTDLVIKVKEGMVLEGIGGIHEGRAIMPDDEWEKRSRPDMYLSRKVREGRDGPPGRKKLRTETLEEILGGESMEDWD